jgi:hypothetical protein
MTDRCWGESRGVVKEYPVLKIRLQTGRIEEAPVIPVAVGLNLMIWGGNTGASWVDKKKA